MKDPQDYLLDERELEKIRLNALHLAGIGLCRFRFDGTILHVDEKYLSFFDLDLAPADVAGHKTFEFYTALQSRPAIVEEIIARGGLRNEEFCFRTPSGQIKWLVHDSYVVDDPQAGERVIQVAARDITKEKLIEEDLRASEALHRALTEATPDVVCLVALDGTVLHASPKGLALHGYGDPKEILGRNFIEYVHPDMRSLALEAYAGLLRTPLVTGTTLKIRNRDGSWFWGELSSAVIRDGAGNPLRCVVTIRDVTERKKAEEELGRSEALYRALVTASPDIVSLTDLMGKILYTSPQGVALQGFDSADEIVGRNFLEFVHPDFRAFALKNFQESMGQPVITGVQLPILKKDGSHFSGELSSALIFDEKGAPVSCMVTIRDISGRKKMEEKLRKSEAMYRALVQTSPDGIAMTGREGRLLYVSPQLARMHGYDDTREMQGRLFDEMVAPEWRARARAAFEAGLQSGEVHDLDLGLIKKGGGTFIGSVNGSALKDENGESGGLIVAIRDMTDRLRMEEDKRKADRMYKLLIDTMPDTITISSTEGKILFISEKGGELLHMEDVSGLVGASIFDLVHEDDRDRAMAALPEVLSRGEFRNLEFRIRRPEGSVFYGSFNASALKEDGVGEGRIVITSRDITELKEAENKLRESEARYRVLFESAVEGILVAETATRRFIYANPAICKFLGYPESELIGRRVDDIHPPEGMEKVQDHFDFQVRREYYDAPGLPCLKKDGTVVYADIHSNPAEIDGKPCLIGFFTDVTERRRMEEKLRESEARYRALAETAPEGILVAAVDDKRFLYANPAIQRMFGYEKKDFLQKRVSDIHPEWALNEALSYFTSLVNGRLIMAPGLPCLKADGSIFHADIHASLSALDGRPCLIGFFTDVSIRQRMEEELRESEEKFRLISEQSLLGIAIFQDNRIQYINRAAAEIMETTAVELAGMDFADFINFVHLEERDEAAGILRRKQAGTPEPVEINVFRVTTRTGRSIWIETFSKTITYRGRPADLVTVLDVTDKRRMEAELIKAEKLESVGLLAGGIAHDFNNILTAVLGNISLAHSIAAGQERLERRLEEAEKACQRARELTQQLLTFTTSGAPIKAAASVKELVEESARFALRGTNARCEFDAQPGLWPFRVDAGQISQVIHNIVLNAAQAMPRGGTVKVIIENLQLTPEVVREHYPRLNPGPYALISIIDEGMGIPEENLSKIFDPFFTTKTKGSGLGLATSYSIIKRHQGHIEVSSRKGKGAVFRLYLPAAPDEIVEQQAREQTTVPGKGRILVMDDEEAILEIVSLMLEDLGYQAQTARNGEEAVEIYCQNKKSGSPFDAVILDLTVPGAMGGKEAVKKLRETDPQLKAIVSSGYSTDPVMADFASYGFQGVVAKPYDLEGLSRALARILES